MRLLVIGGSGTVGAMVVPVLARTHIVRVFDVRPPNDDGVEYLAGTVADYDALYDAVAGIDALLYFAMNPKRDWGSPTSVSEAFDINVKGLYLALWAAADQGLRHAVYASTLNVQRDEDISTGESGPAVTDHFYGYTKGLGEDVCRHAVRARGMTVTALRLCQPTADEDWPPTGTERRRAISTKGSDVAAAFDAALRYRDGFEAFNISGDVAERYVPISKAKALLGWTPTS